MHRSDRPRAEFSDVAAAAATHEALIKHAIAWDGVLADAFEVQFDADTRRIRQGNVPVIDDRRSAVRDMDVAVPHLALLKGVPLENEEVRHRSADMAGRHGAKRSGNEMRSERKVVDLREMCDFPTL